jgi:hypothetical protein
MNIQHPTSNIQHPTSNIEHPILRAVRSANIYRLVTFLCAIGITQAKEHESKRYSRELPTGRLHTDKIREMMEKFMIPKVEFRDVGVREALDYLKIQGARPGLEMNLFTRVGPEEPPPISLTLENVSFVKLLDAICAKAGLFWKIGNRAIVIGSRDYVSKSEE